MDVGSHARHERSGFAGVVAELDAMGDAGLTARFRELELLQRQVTAEMAAITDQVDRRGSYRDDGHRSVAGWLRAQANYSGRHTRLMGRLGRLLAVDTQVGEDLVDGRIGVDQAAELARAFANPRCGRQLTGSIDVLLDHAQRIEFDDFRRCVQRWEILSDLDGAHRDRGDHIRARRATINAGINGVDVDATGGTALQAAGMAAILEQFTAAEFQRDCAELRDERGPHAPSSQLARSDAQRRFDALVAIFHTANNSPGDNTPPVATVDIVCDQHSFEAALANHHLADEPVDLAAPDPANTRCHTSTGIALLPDDIVLAALGGWIRRRVINAANVTINMSRKHRVFTGAANDAARLVATTCEMPGCIVPQQWSQIDHMTEWGHNGPTDQDNASIMCGHHNRHKHHRQLHTRRDHNGHLHVQRPNGTWITPVGADPPTDIDFYTPNQLRQHVLDRLGI